MSISGWRSAAGLAAFWIVAAMGALLLCVAWSWYGLAFSEEMTEQGKAEAAGSTEAGTGLLLGGVPLVLAHVVVLLVLTPIGATQHSRPGRGVLLALVAVAVASGIGIAAGQLLWGGCLFAMSAYSQCPAFVP